MEQPPNTAVSTEIPCDPSQRVRGLSGFTLIEMLIVVALLAIIMSVMMPYLIASKMAARESSAVAHLRLLKTIMEQYRMDNGTYPTTLATLVAEGHITGFSVWVDDISRTGYLFHIDPGPDPTTWAIQSNPLTPGFTGTRYFRMDTTGQIRWNDVGPALETDPPLN